ncbi:MAG: Na+/H+ antiporter subunit E [Desulfobacterales bacterium]|nr:Na+/H+ antiporter subunit E [Desulfobacterales bacterium]
MKSDRTGKKQGVIHFCVTFLLTFFFWVLFSGRFDGFHLGLGVVSCLMVSGLTRRLVFYGDASGGLFIAARFLRYLPWLVYQILLANLHLLYLTFHPRMMDKINPRIIRFDTSLKSDLSRTTFANSITLTPGTITVYAGVMGGFAVHCIDEHSGRALPGAMEKRISEVFRE